MSLIYRKIGFAFTGSFCTYQSAFRQLEALVKEGAQVQAIFSHASASTNSRFGEWENFLKRAEEITGNPVLQEIPEVEPIGPKALLDVMVVLPCTGNTIAKLANGITDGPVTMAVKAHLRNERPVVLSLSTNDALGMNLKNIGTLMNSKNIYFVPFGQDSPIKKPNSMIAHTELLIPTIESALEGKQIQPVVVSPF